MEERPPSTAPDHPPFRLRERRRFLLPDLAPPTLEELRWAARQRRARREDAVPQPRQAVEQVEQLEHGVADEREQAAVAAATEVSVLDELTLEPTVIDLTAHEVAGPPEPELPEQDERDERDERGELDESQLPELRPWRPSQDEPPLVSHVLVVHEPAPVEPARIAVLDEIEVAAPTVTRLVPLPVAEPDYVDEPHQADVAEAAGDEPVSTPLYWRLLRLRYTRPNGWLRALYFEGAVALAVVLVLAEVASVWTIVVLPFVVAVVVKANDVLAGNLRRAYQAPQRR
ncbi:MAG TPA: hypothetical protein VHC43_01705 [Mycobacteriales bacterium]|nr:hypothetical protein [Mycobacteriales bacterium]